LVTFAVLFDIDGTLVSSVVAEDDERRRYTDAIRDVVGQTPNVVPGRFAGMVDPQICQILLTELGFTNDKVDYFVPKVLSRMSELYRGMDKTIALNSGVEELLPLLVKSPRHAVGVLTGNLEQIAREKLACAEILSYFSEFYCADRYFDRTRLVGDAVDSCVRKYQLPARRNVMIVGDTPRDIAAANASEATSIGVASSAVSMRQLTEAEAVQVYPNLRPTKELLAGLGLDS
jgi:phosphoglycolate phosphatase-like HAD superfamily hydrolase